MRLVGRRLKIIALLAWYDEPPEMLYDSLLSVAPHIDYLVAVDGSYPYYPSGTPESPKEQHDAIRDALAIHHKGWEIITPGRIWNNEVEKRNYMFEYASHRSTVDDWYLIWDADFFLKRCDGLYDRLSTTGSNVATVELRSAPESREPPVLAHRLLYRAHPTLHCVDRHNVYAYTTDVGSDVFVWGHQNMIAAADMTASVGIWHDPGRRSAERMASREIWHREQGRIEAGAY